MEAKGEGLWLLIWLGQIHPDNLCILKLTVSYKYSNYKIKIIMVLEIMKVITIRKSVSSLWIASCNKLLHF